MQFTLSLSLGELVLKGKNRNFFIRQMLRQINKLLADFPDKKIISEMGKIFIEVDPDQKEAMINKLKHVFGLVYIIPSWKLEANMEAIEAGTLSYIDQVLKDHPEFKTFKVEANRADKSFPIKSPEINRQMGAFILENFPQLRVDVHEPDFVYTVDVRSKAAYLYHEKIPAIGGLPLRTNGKGLLLLSGGIDSPVAGYLMAKRGVEVHGLHFHSYPFTSKQAEDKVLKIGKILTSYTLDMKIFSVNILPMQRAIRAHCSEDQMTVLSRRFMMRVANAIVKREGYHSVITGENLGQVASQTIEGLTVMDDVADYLVLRPLIGLDKTNIIDIAQDIGTYETSIIPFEDSCTIFAPKRPVLHPTVAQMEEAEEALDLDRLVEEALETMVVHEIH
ncbi:MAG: tRNA uracil 4-sulfurtransferase ThiI [Tissierellia bacterium]|nr:tRNA uracil 4-sulfurtransferase ThiI [Tissierellia bacterium]